MSERLVRWAKKLAAGQTVVSVRVIEDAPEVVMVMTVPGHVAGLAARQVSNVMPLDVPDWIQVEGVDVTVRFSDREDVEASRPVIDDEAWT